MSRVGFKKYYLNHEISNKLCIKILKSFILLEKKREGMQQSISLSL